MTRSGNGWGCVTMTVILSLSKEQRGLRSHQALSLDICLHGGPLRCVLLHPTLQMRSWKPRAVSPGTLLPCGPPAQPAMLACHTSPWGLALPSGWGRDDQF